MRYLGNKTRLLGFIRRVLRSRGVRGGTAVDPFTGTASVARALKRIGFQVTASDIMQYGYVLARAQVGLCDVPDFTRLAAELGLRQASARAVMTVLNRLAPAPSFISGHYSPAGGERMYFTPANAARIDATRTAVHRWHTLGWIDEAGHDFLLAAVIEGADRVANTTGVYAAFVKSWQPNALRTFQLRAPRLVRGVGCRVFRGEALAVVRALEPFDLLYLDPPYNNRQYAGYYHIPEVLALGWFDAPLQLRGKTGLIEDAEKRSDWSSSRRCELALETLVAAAPCRHIMMSYNAEGLIPERTIERVLKAYGRRGSYRRYTRTYRRYRSDSDSATRTYRGDQVTEYLYCADRA